MDVGAIGRWTPRQLLITCARVYGVVLGVAVIISTVRAWRAWHDPGLSPDELPPSGVLDVLGYALGKMVELTPLALLPAAALVVFWLWKRQWE